MAHSGQPFPRDTETGHLHEMDRRRCTFCGAARSDIPALPGRHSRSGRRDDRARVSSLLVRGVVRRLTTGLSRTRLFTPETGDTAAAVGNAGVDVAATVTLILWVEEVCGDLLHPALEDGEASVGARVAVDHTGPAWTARPVAVESRITAVDGRRITFAVAARQDGREVMTGEHERVVVSLARFLEGASRSAPEAAPAAGERVSFWFDVISPWSYLASLTIGRLARRRGVGVDWRPVHLASLMDAVDGMRPMEQSPPRRAWYLQDIVDRMDEAGLPYHPHDGQPMRPSRALRCMAHAADSEILRNPSWNR